MKHKDIGVAAVGWMRARDSRFGYCNDRPQKLDPDRYGVTDCSGAFWRAYFDNGVHLADNDMSYEIARAGTHVATGSSIAEFNSIRHLLRPGDAVCMALRSGYGGGARINHIEMNDDGFYGWGHGGYPPMGPTRAPLAASHLLGDAAWWTVRRIVQPPTTLSKEEIMAKADRVFVTHKGTVYAWNTANDELEKFTNPKQLEKRRMVYDRLGIVWKNWRDFTAAKKSDEVEDLSWFGKVKN